MVVQEGLTDPPVAPERIRGTRAGAIVFVGIATANIGNYLFHLISARYLGPVPYGDVAALVAFAGFISLPLGGLQVAAAREVARLSATGQHDVIAGLLRRSLGIAAIAALGLTVILIALSTFLQSAMQIHSLAAVVLTALVIGPAIMTPIVWGTAQGLERFGLLSAAMALGPIVRVAVLVALLVAGFEVAGAMAATLIAATVALAAPLWLLRATIFRAGHRAAHFPYRRAAKRLAPVVVGILAITSLTTLDVIVAKGSLPGEDAGIYGGASLIGRVILYLPTAAVVTVLLPKVSARVAQHQESVSLLNASLLVTGVFVAAATACYALVPRLVVDIAFGSSFKEAVPLLWLFAAAMSAYSILNVLLFYHLACGVADMSWLLLAGAALEVVGFALFHESARQLLGVSIATAAALLVTHELVIDRSLTRAARHAVGLTRARLRG